MNYYNDLDTHNYNERKVNIGVRVAPLVKQELLKEARTAGVTISELTELIISMRNDDNQEEIQHLKKRLRFYEEGFLTQEFDMKKGKHLSYVDSNGVQRHIRVTKIEDIFTIVINSVKKQ